MQPILTATWNQYAVTTVSPSCHITGGHQGIWKAEVEKHFESLLHAVSPMSPNIVWTADSRGICLFMLRLINCPVLKLHLVYVFVMRWTAGTGALLPLLVRWFSSVLSSSFPLKVPENRLVVDSLDQLLLVASLSGSVSLCWVWGEMTRGWRFFRDI